MMIKITFNKESNILNERDIGVRKVIWCGAAPVSTNNQSSIGNDKKPSVPTFFLKNGCYNIYICTNEKCCPQVDLVVSFLQSAKSTSHRKI